MNKPKYQMTNRARKKMNKEVRASTLPTDPPLMSDKINPKSILKKYPKKVQKKETASLKSLAKNLTIKTKKKKASHSKRTSPGSLGTEEREATPRNAHIEGTRWIKATESKIQTDKKVLRRTLLKKRGR